MPIQYRCLGCDQLLSISTRKAGLEVPCPTCGELTFVPNVTPTEDALFDSNLVTYQLVATRSKGTDQEKSDTDGDSSPVDAGVPERSQRRNSSRESPHSPVSEPEEERIVDSPVPEEGGFQARKPDLSLGDLDLTSMVDVTFLLLIFFMVTASFSLQKTIELPPPKQDDKGASQSLTLEDLEANTIFVRIDEKNSIFVDDVPSGDPSKLDQVLTQSRLTTLRNEVAIDAHPETLHETVVLVIDAATAAGMQKVRIVSHAAPIE